MHNIKWLVENKVNLTQYNLMFKLQLDKEFLKNS